jgi:hypothetical protein
MDYKGEWGGGGPLLPFRIHTAKNSFTIKATYCTVISMSLSWTGLNGQKKPYRSTDSLNLKINRNIL